MKLIDLLLQELPKQGGWPVIALAATSAVDEDYIRFVTEVGDLNLTAFPCRECWGTVTREQYEAALAASQNPAWNGEGLPPVDTECEIDDGITWHKSVVIAHYKGMVFAWSEENDQTRNSDEARHFRPIRTEAERKRKEAVDFLMGYMHHAGRTEVEFIYDAIAAGKIPGVKLDDL